VSLLVAKQFLNLEQLQEKKQLRLLKQPPLKLVEEKLVEEPQKLLQSNIKQGSTWEFFTANNLEIGAIQQHGFLAKEEVLDTIRPLLSQWLRLQFQTEETKLLSEQDTL
jgi:hypothetical protein